MTTARAAARTALEATAAQLRRLDGGDFENYAAHEPGQVEACRAILEWPIADFDDETQALVGELVALQRQVCEQFDRLLAASVSDGSRLGRGRRAVQAYGSQPAAAALRIRAG